MALRSLYRSPSWPGVSALALALLLGACERRPSPPTGAAPMAPAQRSAAAPPPAVEDAPIEPPEPEPEAPAEVADAPPKPPAEPEIAALAPLTEAQRASLMAGEEEALARQKVSFVKSNEIRHDLWFPYIEGIGGAYVGLGSDPNFTLIGVARSEYVFLVDRDPLVANVHRVYGILIEASPDPESLHQRFDPEQRDVSLQLIDDATAELPKQQRRKIRQAYRGTRETLWRYLRPLEKRQRDGCPTSWMSNQDLYDHVRTLFSQGRVRPMTGDLRGATTMRTIADAAQALGVPVNVLYLSNAEEYFTYNRAFRRNLAGLPTEPGGVVLRTIFDESWEHADNFWNYQVHDFTDFQRRLQRDYLTRTAMWRRADGDGALQRTTETKGLSRLGIPTPPPPRDAVLASCPPLPADGDAPR